MLLVEAVEGCQMFSAALVEAVEECQILLAILVFVKHVDCQCCQSGPPNSEAHLHTYARTHTPCVVLGLLIGVTICGVG